MERRKKADTPGAETKASALARLDPPVAQQVLNALLRAHPELRTDAEEIARAMTSEPSFIRVAERVERALEGHGLDELSSRAGEARGGHVGPEDAAHQILHEAIEPIIAEMDRFLELRLQREALETCQGLILGLYDSRDKQDDGCLGRAGDFAWNMAEEVLEKWSKGIRGKGTRSARARLRSFLDDVAIDWSSMFERVLSR